MENTKENILIAEVEPKTTKAGKSYMRIKTERNGSTRWMSCFNADVNEALKALVGQVVTVETKQSGDFFNIMGCHGEAPISGLSEEDEKTATEAMNKPQKQANGNTAMYVSYVKDLIVSGKKKEEAIQDIKDIKEAFS